jgi:hypothetical protein
MAESVIQFITQAYRLIGANNPTVPLHGNDFEQGLLILNELLESYASTGLLLTIAKYTNFPLVIGQQFVTVGPADLVPTPDIPLGRLANLEDAWLTLSNVSYPLINMSRDEFLSSFRYEPLQGLPRFVIVFPDTEVVKIQLYPAPSEFFLFNLRAKFQLTTLLPSDDMSGLPTYYTRFLKFAVARDIAMYKGRADAWTEKLDFMMREAQDKMEAASEVNLSITGDRASLLNGSWRVRSGI